MPDMDPNKIAHRIPESFEPQGPFGSLPAVTGNYPLGHERGGKKIADKMWEAAIAAINHFSTAAYELKRGPSSHNQENRARLSELKHLAIEALKDFPRSEDFEERRSASSGMHYPSADPALKAYLNSVSAKIQQIGRTSPLNFSELLGAFTALGVCSDCGLEPSDPSTKELYSKNAARWKSHHGIPGESANPNMVFKLFTERGFIEGFEKIGVP